MKRERSGRSREGTTLGDALSSQVKDQLRHLRDTLEKQTRDVVANQLAEGPPPWHRKRRLETAPEPSRANNSPGPAPSLPTLAGRRQSGRDITNVRAEPRSLRKPKDTQKPKFRFWDFPSEAVVRNSPPKSVSNSERTYLEHLLQTGNDSSTADGDELFIILGLDFGTRSTKVIIRLPFEPGEPTIAIPAPNACRSGKDPYLWQTFLWLMEDGTFHPLPEPGATVLSSIKQGLLHGRSEAAIFDSEAAITVSRAQAATAYLAFVIRYVRGWLLRKRPHLFRRRRPVWFVNLGMPAASYDDLNLAEPYRRIGAAALQLAKVPTSITVEASQLFLDNPPVAKASASTENAEELGIAVIPEAAAEMTGFAKSARSAPGTYLLVDVGALTLDACLFRLDQNVDTGDLYSFIAAQVRPLGVESFYWFLEEGKTQSEFIQQCDRALKVVAWKTKQRNEIPVFLAGGGAANHLHRETVSSIGPWLERYAPSDGIRLLDLPVPRTIELPEPLEKFGRMAVALGLSYPRTEIGRIVPMRDLENIPPPVVDDPSTRFISKDQI